MIQEMNAEFYDTLPGSFEVIDYPGAMMLPMEPAVVAESGATILTAQQEYPVQPLATQPQVAAAMEFYAATQPQVAAGIELYAATQPQVLQQQVPANIQQATTQVKYISAAATQQLPF